MCVSFKEKPVQVSSTRQWLYFSLIRWQRFSIQAKQSSRFLYWIKSLLWFVTRWSSWSLVIDCWTVPRPGLRVPSDRAGWKSDLGWNAATRHTWGTVFVCLPYCTARINGSRECRSQKRKKVEKSWFRNVLAKRRNKTIYQNRHFYHVANVFQFSNLMIWRRMTNSFFVLPFFLFSYCPDIRSATLVHWCFCILDNLWYPFLVRRLAQNKVELPTKTLHRSQQEERKVWKIQGQIQREIISAIVWRDHGRTRLRSKLMSFNHSPVTLDLFIGLLEIVLLAIFWVSLRKLFRKRNPLKCLRGYFQGSILTDKYSNKTTASWEVRWLADG